MKEAKDLIPWSVTDISVRPYEDYWSMNPSIHFDGQIWRCVLRCTDYAMPGGVTVRSKKSRPAGNQSKNAMLVLDPHSWKPIRIFKMQERDNHARVACANVGFEDMRLFRSDRGGFQGIAASLHLRRESRPADGGAHNQPPEQVLVSFDAEYNIVSARPIRGDWWSGTPQKNWVPFDDSAEPRFLYSIGNGTMFDDHGAVHGDAAIARPSVTARALSSKPPSSPPSLPAPPSQPAAVEEVSARGREEQEERERRDREERERRAREEHERQEHELREREAREQEERKRRERSRDPRSRLPIRGTDVSMVRGGRVSTGGTPARPSSTRHAMSRGNDTTRVMGTGRTLMPRYEGLRGGSQLVRVGDDSWLGIAHEMKFVSSRKYYWHTWYLVDARGKMTSASQPMKLVSNGIEFAAGMVIDGDRVVVSFGVDDMECRIGETKLSAVMEMLKPVER